ncbi:protein translocase subunit SecDF [uncultured Bacteroides sp.]|uniref:protein translocase subunit SecDF n=1 Tax=uncultured Bacteroides sp. TaxID=162156 RepID=UPI002AAC1C64|nr:protein translocase subunit SecDF [uncultured Bacteroides sp.]
MQNKGLVKVFAVLLTLVCVFYLSFSFVTRHYMNKAAEYAKGDPKLEQEYIDSLSSEKVWLHNYTLKQCREMEISLGLDLKGGMNVILEVSVGDVIKSLADHKEDATFNKAVASAQKLSEKSQTDFITLFINEYHRLAPGARLSELFATQQLKDKISQKSSDSEVEKVLREEVKAAINNSYNVLSTRIDRFGVVQPNIQTLPDKIGRIMVELPGIKEPERVRKLLQGSANLEFWETYESKEIVPYFSSIDNKIRMLAEGKGVAVSDTTAKGDSLAKKDTTALAAAKVSAKDSLLAALKGKTVQKEEKGTNQLAKAKKEHPLLSIFQPNTSGYGCIVGYANHKDTALINRYLAMKQVMDELPKDLRLKWGVKAAEGDKKGQTFELYAIKSTERNGRAPLEGDVVTDAKDVFDQYGKPAVSMSMNSEGSRRWALMTKQNIGKAIAIVLDGYVYSAPNVNGEISGGNSEITGHFTPEESKDLANVLKSGKMPAPAHIVQEDIIGPSLGQESINAGIISFAVAIVILMCFMCFMYGFIPGMIANGALIFNLFFTLGILSSYQAALTLSGIAGMVLTLGIAVDANVLIYERTKEELRAGKNTKNALTDGYKNAFSAIFDGHFTSILTGIILFYFGTGPIRGFATTLIIGILMSFFTSVFMTRVVYDHFMSKDKLLNLPFSSKFSKNLLVHTHFDFVGANKRVFAILGIILVVCLGSLATRGLSSSIDFTGGRNYVLQFSKQVEPEQVRSLMANKFGKDATVSVIAIGTDGKKVRLSTNYRISENGNSVDTDIETMIYEALKDKVLLPGTKFDTFKTSDVKAGGCIISSAKVGPSVAEDIKVGAIWSVVFAWIGIGLYILLRFKDISYSVGSVLALCCDTIIIVGVYSLLWGILPFSMEVDQTFIGAVLTALGYSMNDKVVIFDRVREFFHLYPKHDRTELFNDSLNTTLSRTINTSLCTLLVLLCIFILGADSIRSFSFAMILGVVVGTLSSLFVASPIAFLIQQKEAKKHAQALEK